MQTRKLGRSGLEVSALGLGCRGLARLLAQKPWIVPIPGTTKPARLAENVGALSIGLTPEDLRDVGAAAAKIAVQGARYPEHLERMTGL